MRIYTTNCNNFKYSLFALIRNRQPVIVSQRQCRKSAQANIVERQRPLMQRDICVVTRTTKFYFHLIATYFILCLQLGLFAMLPRIATIFLQCLTTQEVSIPRWLPRVPWTPTSSPTSIARWPSWHAPGSSTEASSWPTIEITTSPSPRPRNFRDPIARHLPGLSIKLLLYWSGPHTVITMMGTTHCKIRWWEHLWVYCQCFAVDNLLPIGPSPASVATASAKLQRHRKFLLDQTWWILRSLLSGMPDGLKKPDYLDDSPTKLMHRINDLNENAFWTDNDVLATRIPADLPSNHVVVFHWFQWLPHKLILTLPNRCWVSGWYISSWRTSAHC